MDYVGKGMESEWKSVSSQAQPVYSNVPYLVKTPQRHCFQTVFVPPQMSQTFEYEVSASAERDAQALMMMAQEPPDSPRYKQIPPRYHSMKFLREACVRSRVLDGQGTELVTGSLGYLSSVYKVVDSADGYCYALRRVERVRTNNEIVVVGA